MHFKNEAEINGNSSNSNSVPIITTPDTTSKTASISCSSSTDSGVIIIDNQTTNCCPASSSNGGNSNYQFEIDDIGDDQEHIDIDSEVALQNTSNTHKESTARFNSQINNKNAKDNSINKIKIPYINNTSNEQPEKLNNINTFMNNTNNVNSFHSNQSYSSPIKNKSNHSNINFQDEKSSLHNDTLPLNENEVKKRQINIENIINISNNGNASSTITVKDRQNYSPSCKRRPHTPSLSATKEDSENSPNSHFVEGRSSKAYSPTLSVRSTTISIVSIDENAVDSSIIDSDSEQDADAEGEHNNYIVKKLGQQTTYPPQSDALSNLNKGMRVVGQTINPDGHTGVGPIAEKVLNGGLCVPNNVNGSLQPIGPPQIGSVALTNSTDVTFGDKHFYKGPVTIQQFLIDSRDKWKAHETEGGQDNPSFSHENGQSPPDDAPKSNTLSDQDQHPHFLINNRKALFITGTIVGLTVLVGVITMIAMSLLQTQNPEEIDDGPPLNTTLQILGKGDWKGRPHTGIMDKLVLPVHRVIIMHTASDTCFDKQKCSVLCRNIQAFHMDSFHWDDIGYNFMIGGDGHVYQGRGWYNQGAHTKGYNVDSIGIAFIGTFSQIKPSEKQLVAAQLLIEEGSRLKKLHPDYRLYGARQLSATESPGDILFGLIKNWPHFSTEIDL